MPYRDPEQQAAYHKTYFARRKERLQTDLVFLSEELAYHRNYRYASRYGLTTEQVQAKVASQGCKCAICGKVFAKLTGRGGPYVDHDHKTGEVRGILCPRCNQWVGWFEQTEFREAVEAYLRKYEG